MGLQTSKINTDRLLVAAAYSVAAATKVSLIIALVQFISFIQFLTLSELIISLLGGLLTLIIIGGVITFVVSLFIGIPIAIILIKSGLDDVLFAAIVASIIVVLGFICFSIKEAYVLFFMIYSFFCAGAFMKGYKKA
jgi:hypothetical protein